MLKNFYKAAIFIFLLIFLLLFTSLAPLAKAEALGSADAYKAIVKIYTYYENSDNELEIYKAGSGVILNNEGVILTNYHVIALTDYFDNEVPVAFNICLTTSTTAFPDCSYSADLLAKDKNSDIALLRIRNINGIPGQNIFDYLQWQNNSEVTQGTAVQALGYPDSGGSTITITSGIASGTSVDSGQTMIKTDALTSFGSSGGALIGNSGNLIGINTSKSGGLGYAVSINSISSWINNNINNTSQPLNLQSRLNNHLIIEYNLQTSNVFTNNLPNLTVTREKNWSFYYSDETGLSIYNDLNNDQGSLKIKWIRMPVNQANSLADFIKAERLIPGNNIVAVEDITFNGRPAKKVTHEVSGQNVYGIYLARQNYIIYIIYALNEKNIKFEGSELQKIINSINAADNSFIELKTYQNSNPYFKISAPADWGLQINNLADKPLSGESNVNDKLSFGLFLRAISDNLQKMSNSDYFNYIKNDDLVSAQYDNFGLKKDLYFSSADYKINNELPHEIFYKYRFKDGNDGDKVKVLAAGYRIRDNDRDIVIAFEYFGSDEAAFDQSLEDFKNTFLVNLTLGRQVSNLSEATNPAAVNPAPAPTASSLSGSKSAIVSVKKLTTTFARRLIGKVLLQVQDKFQAWYLSPKTWKAYYLINDQDAYKILKAQGYAIRNTSLAKIPIGTKNLTGTDSDNDGLPDNFEAAIKTNPNSADSDGDGYDDKTEIDNNYDPLLGNKKKLPINKAFTNYEKGRIMLQYQGKNEMWYLNPADGKRYFIAPDNVINTMRKLGLGISNTDFAKIK